MTYGTNDPAYHKNGYCLSRPRACGGGGGSTRRRGVIETSKSELNRAITQREAVIRRTPAQVKSLERNGEEGLRLEDEKECTHEMVSRHDA